VRAGLAVFAALHATAAVHVVLATDLHAGNVLAADRQPWLVIDPKPFVGDPAYDATQHLLNCRARVREDPVGTIRGFSDLLEVDDERVWLWLFARAASATAWSEESVALARVLVR
jgi:streptomycin 6-kinase